MSQCLIQEYATMFSNVVSQCMPRILVSHSPLFVLPE